MSQHKGQCDPSVTKKRSYSTSRWMENESHPYQSRWISTHMCKHTHVHTNTHVYMCKHYAHTCTHTRTQPHTQEHPCTWTHMCVHKVWSYTTPWSTPGRRRTWQTRWWWCNSVRLWQNWQYREFWQERHCLERGEKVGTLPCGCLYHCTQWAVMETSGSKTWTWRDVGLKANAGAGNNSHS